MGDLIFKENTQKMYDTMLELAPKPFREITKQQLDEALDKACGESGEVTEEKFMEVVNTSTPKAFLPMALNVLDPLLTDK